MSKAKGAKSKALRIELIGTVVGAGVLLLAYLVWMDATHGKHVLKSAFAAVGRLVHWHVMLPGWLLVLLCMFAGVTVMGLVLLCIALLESKPPPIMVVHDPGPAEHQGELWGGRL